MPDTSPISTKNRILNALPEEDLARLRPHLEHVELASGKVLYEPDEKIRDLYFPDSAMISVVAYTEEGQGAEVAVIGREGATGIEVLTGSGSTPNQNITQLANGAVRISAEAVKEEFARGGVLHDLMLRFIGKLLVQVSQTALCNRLHPTDQRLSRWLLMCHDRADSDVLNLTQEFIAIMLGANRATVTLTSIQLQNAGLISYKRGKITVLDRAGLEAYTCDCYRVIKTAYQRK